MSDKIKTYTVGGIAFKLAPIKINLLYSIMKLLKNVKKNLNIDITDAEALKNVQYDQIIDAVIESDLLGELLRLILIPADSKKEDAIVFNELELDEAFLEVLQDFFTKLISLVKKFKAIKSVWDGMN